MLRREESAHRSRADLKRTHFRRDSLAPFGNRPGSSTSLRTPGRAYSRPGHPRKNKPSGSRLRTRNPSATLFPMDSMPRKFPWHDFKRPGWYLVTLHCAVRGRNVLAEVKTGGGFARTRLGEIAEREGRKVFAASGGALVAHAFQLMPDHVHVLLHVARPLPRPLGSFVGAWKAAATTAVRSEAGFTKDRPLWRPGFDWEIKTTPEAVAGSRLYVEGNPAAAREKRAAKARWGAPRTVAHPRLPGFWPDDPESDPLVWTAFGNEALLGGDRLVPVRVSQREPEARLLRMEERARALAREGAVLVSPAVSPGEKRALDAALGAGGSAIHLESRPVNLYYKPAGLRLAALSEGRLLVLTPMQETSRRPKRTRVLCEALNACAKAIAASPEHTPASPEQAPAGPARARSARGVPPPRK